MSEANSKAGVLVIAFRFPPYSQVGAFRWGRFARYLAALGHNVDVITVDWKMPDRHGMLADLSDIPQIHATDAGKTAKGSVAIHRIPSTYPHNLKHRAIANRYLDLARKAAYKFFIDRFLYHDDEAQHWGRHLIPAAKRLIEEKNIPVVIATGAPFSCNHWASQLKAQRPNIKLIQDMRDPWTANPVAHFRNIDKAREHERECLTRADHIVTVSPGLAEIFRDLSGGETPISVIHNGYDPAIISARVVDPANKAIGTSPISMAHIGNVTNQRDEPLRALLSAIARRPDALEKFRVVQVGSVSRRIHSDFSDLIDNGVLNLVDHLPQTEALSLLCKHDYALQLNARIYPFALSTKIFEYAALKVPTISINYGGDIEELVQANSFGISVRADAASLDRILDQLIEGDVPREFSFAVAGFSIPALAATYSQLIEDLSSSQYPSGEVRFGID